MCLQVADTRSQLTANPIIREVQAFERLEALHHCLLTHQLPLFLFSQNQLLLVVLLAIGQPVGTYLNIPFR